MTGSIKSVPSPRLFMALAKELKISAAAPFKSSPSEAALAGAPTSAIAAIVAAAF